MREGNGRWAPVLRCPYCGTAHRKYLQECVYWVKVRHIIICGTGREHDANCLVPKMREYYAQWGRIE